MAKPLRIGVIGLGNMGAGHCRTLQGENTPELKLTAVSTRRAQRRAWAEQEFGVPAFPTAEALTGSGLCDAVLVAVPHYQHAEITIDALRQGLHVLCEKPAAVASLAAHEMVDTAREQGKALGVIFNQRTNTLYREMKRRLSSGEMGAAKRVNWIITDWYRPQAYYNSGTWRATWQGDGGGVLLNQAPHQLDLLLWLCGMPVRVRAFCHEHKWHDIEVEDDVTAYLEYENGGTGVFVTSTGDLPGTNRLEISTDRGKLLCENNTLSIHKLPVSEPEYRQSSENFFGKPSVEITEIKGETQHNQYANVMNAFAAHILRGEPLTATGQDGLDELMLSNAMYLSSWLDRPVTMPHDEALFLKLLNQRRAASKQKE